MFDVAIFPSDLRINGVAPWQSLHASRISAVVFRLAHGVNEKLGTGQEAELD